MKKWWLYLIIIVLAAFVFAEWQQVKHANQKWQDAMNNVKAYSQELSSEKNKNVVYKLTIDQLKNYNDSILIKLDEARKELKIKDKDLKGLQYVSSTFTKRDTVTLRDTLFREPSFTMDTLISNEWYKVGLGLRYPSTVIVEPEFKSEKYLIVASKKETVNPPKKFFLLRWFQKKHRVVSIYVVERNPYVQGEQNKFVEIVK